MDAEEFAWGLDYFADNIQRIIDETKADIYTEVGISFLLAGQDDHPAVARVKRALRAYYDPQARMIPSESGGTGLAHGEHRNVLAIMLFRWPQRLHPGPDLSRQAIFRDYRNYTRNYTPMSSSTSLSSYSRTGASSPHSGSWRKVLVTSMGPRL